MSENFFVTVVVVVVLHSGINDTMHSTKQSNKRVCACFLSYFLSGNTLCAVSPINLHVPHVFCFFFFFFSIHVRIRMYMYMILPVSVFADAAYVQSVDLRDRIISIQYFVLYQ